MGIQEEVQKLSGDADMLGYELYLRDPIKGYQLMGILPERRRGPNRITKQSVFNWAKKNFGSNLNLKKMFFFEVEIDLMSARQGLDAPAHAYFFGQRGSKSPRRNDLQLDLEEMVLGEG